MPSPKISTFREIIPLIYSWRTPDIPKYEGWEKIGYTEQETADAAHRAAGDPSCPSRRRRSGRGGRCSPPRPAGASRTRTSTPTSSSRASSARPQPKRTEWHHFATAPKKSLDYFNDFAGQDFTDLQARRRGRLRPAPRAAGCRRPGRGRLRGGQAEVLWNAKPRFGKTLTTYHLMRTLDVRQGPDRHQPPGDRELLVRRLHALHRPPDHLQVRLGVALAGRPLAHDPRAVACLLAQPPGRGPAHRGVPLAAGPQGVAVLRRRLRQAQAHRGVRLGPAGHRRGPRGHRHHQDRRRVRPDQAQAGHCTCPARRSRRWPRASSTRTRSSTGPTRTSRPPASSGTTTARRTRTRRCRRSTC